MTSIEKRAQLAQVFKHTEHLTINEVYNKWNEYFKPINTHNVQYTKRSKHSTN